MNNKMADKKKLFNNKLNKKKFSDSDSDQSSCCEDEEMNMHEFRKYIQKIFPSKHLSEKIDAGEKLQNKANKLNNMKKQKPSADELSQTTDDDSTNKKKSSNKKNNKHNKSHKKNDIYENDYLSQSMDDDDDVSDDSDYVDESSQYSTEDISDDGDEEEESEEEEYDKKNRQKSKNKKTEKNRKRKHEDDDEESEEDDEDDDDSSVEEVKHKKKTQPKLNIIFTVGDSSNINDDYDDEDVYDSEFEVENSDYETEDEDEEVSSDDSSEEDEEDDDEDLSVEENKTTKKTKNKKTKKETEPKNADITVETDSSIKEPNHETEALIQLKNMLILNPKDKYIKECIKLYEENLKKDKKNEEKKQKKQKAKNMRIFKKILHDKNTLDDYAFYDKLEVNKQKSLIKELREINKITRIEKPYKMTLLETDIPVQFKAAAMKKINTIRRMDPGSGEYYKIKNWIDTFMKIPFTHYKELPINIDNGVELCHEFMENAQKTLDSAVYGLNDAKMQIMQMLGQLLINPKSIGSAIAIHGPPGTGKTSLVKEGISKILNRPFAFIALGGATDSSFLEGHGYTYEGSTWGKIVQILIDSKCMNPVIYFDELDKISETPRGEEIAGILTHLTDTTQNSQFHDKYFAEIDFDLSKCLFIFSYNDETKVNPILKDRMYRIKTKGYSGKEKNVIANKYLLPKIREQVKFNVEDIIITDEVLSYINEQYCQREDGVRNMKRCLEIIHTKLNLYRLMKPDSNLFEGEMSLKVEFPFTVTKDIVGKLIKRESDGLETWRSLYN